MANILLVDGNMNTASAQAIFGSAIKLYNHSPYFASCAQQAMNSINSDLIDMVFLNPDLPRMRGYPVEDGPGLLAEMTQDMLEIPVVLASYARSKEQLEQIAIQSGYKHVVGYETRGRVYDHFHHLPKQPDTIN